MPPSRCKRLNRRQLDWVRLGGEPSQLRRAFRKASASRCRWGKCLAATKKVGSGSRLRPKRPRKRSRPPSRNMKLSSRRFRTASRRSEEHTSELQSLMRISYAVFCLKKKIQSKARQRTKHHHKKKTNKREN